jgi:hypothetical protein
MSRLLAKARTDIDVRIEGEGVDWTRPGDIEVPVGGYGAAGTEVFSAVITTNVKHAA